MKWVTREHPKIDRVACPWLIRRFIDPDAELLFVPADRVREVAETTGAIPYDVEGVELSHDGPRCSFDLFLEHYGLADPHLHELAAIVRGAVLVEPACARGAAHVESAAGDSLEGAISHQPSAISR